MADKIADAFVEIGARTSKFEKGMSGVRKRLGRIGSGFKSLAKTASVAFLAIGATATILSKSVIDAASSFENLEVRLTTFLGSQEKATQAMRFFTEQAEKVPFSLEQVAEAGTTLTAMGADFRKWLPVATDVAAVMGVDLVTAASQLGRAFSGGAGAADVFREKGILNIIKESKGIRDLSKLTLPEFRKAMFDAFVDPQGKIAGAAKGLSKTWTGQLSMVGDSIFKLKKDFGEALLPAMKELVTFTIKPLINEWAEWVKENKELIKEDIAFHIHNIKEAINLLGNATRFAAKNYAEFRATFILASLDMRKTWIDFVTFLKTAWAATTGFFSKKWLLFSTDGISAIDKIKIAIFDLNEDFNNLAASIIKNWNKILTVTKPVLGILGLFSEKLKISQKTLDELSERFSSMADFAKKKIAEISPEFAKLRAEQEKVTADRIKQIEDAANKEKDILDGLRDDFLKNEMERIKTSLKTTKDMGKNEEDFTKKVNDENEKRKTSFGDLTSILRKLQESKITPEVKGLPTVKPELFTGAFTPEKEIKEQTNVVKDSNVILKEMNDTLKTREFIPQASMG
jgi:hypothetical protein